MALWQRVMEHHHVAHATDLSAGSGALAIAASGAFQYHGAAANDVHAQWLDATVDRYSMYMVGSDEAHDRALGGGDEMVADAKRHIGGTMMEVRRLLQPPAEGDRGSEHFR